MVVALLVAVIAIVTLSISNIKMLNWILNSMQKDGWVTKPVQKKKERETKDYIRDLETPETPDIVALRSNFDDNMRM